MAQQICLARLGFTTSFLIADYMLVLGYMTWLPIALDMLRIGRHHILFWISNLYQLVGLIYLRLQSCSHQQVTCLTLLDLSAALDTIDHSILLERLSSWFGISSTALSCIKSYLLNHSFYVNIENSKSFVFQLLYGVPQGSVLGPLLFILYTTPLCTVISNSSANHQLCADDTQLLLSISALDFSHNITLLENTITNVSNWMSSCLLILLKLSFSS